jgi:flagellar basal body-associated protein FliL
MTQDLETPYNPPPLPEQPKKKNTTLIVIIVVVLLLFCCCCVGIIWAGWTFGDVFLQNFEITY